VLAVNTVSGSALSHSEYGPATSSGTVAFCILALTLFREGITAPWIFAVDHLSH